MAMDNNTINKIIKGIDFELVSKFELSTIKNLSFVPVSKQKNNATGQDVFFAVVCKISDLTKIKDYVGTILDNKISFIKLPQEDFNYLFDLFLKKYTELHGAIEEENDDDLLQNDSDDDYFETNEDDDDIEQEFNEDKDEDKAEESLETTSTIEQSSVNTNDDDEEDLLHLEDDNLEDDLVISDEDDLVIDDNAKEELNSENDSKNNTRETVTQVSHDEDINEDIDVDIDTESENKDNDIKITFSSDASTSEADSETETDEQLEAELDAEFDAANNEENEEDYGEDGKPTADVTLVKAPQTKKLGEILIEENLITERQLEIALSESKAQNIPLGHTMVKLGFVSMRDLKEALGAQKGMKYATAEQLKSLPTETSILPEEFIKSNKVIPLSISDKSLVVGMVDPSDKKTISEIVYQTGLKPTVVLVTSIEFENFLSSYYSKDKEATDKLLQKINEDKTLVTNKNELWDQVEQEIEDSDGAVSQLANQIITMSCDRRASDIHIEPMQSGYRVRLRIDGSLQEILKIPAKVDSAVLSRFKVLSKMNIAEHRRAQDGSFTIKYKGRAQDFRVNTLPVAGREKMVIRVLAPQMDSKQAKADKIEVVGASEEDIKKMRYLVSAPNGIVLTAGPTGSGKTTTLYALLRYMNSDDVNITTIEDPVEIKLEGINQSAINSKAGITFANSLRAILRQDPDTILIGEIRDYETLEVAISASLTGHLVLSTIHTNSAAATITRLIEMGAKDYLISSTVSGIIAQRLVKRLCPNCKKEYYPTIEEARKILTDPVEVQKLTKTKLYKPAGCPGCKNTGYLGRLAVLEIMVINNEIRKMIAQRCHDVELEDYAVKQGMKTLKMSCLRHILEGNTSIDEQVRILGLAASE
ncbi:Flp pilus assembly complex ATPase component TadA [bacterium]|nr:Flp pilus assembly complex ATPase component TadA [bacterium]